MCPEHLRHKSCGLLGKGRLFTWHAAVALAYYSHPPPVSPFSNHIQMLNVLNLLNQYLGSDFGARHWHFQTLRMQVD